MLTPAVKGLAKHRYLAVTYGHMCWLARLAGLALGGPVRLPKPLRAPRAMVIWASSREPLRAWQRGLGGWLGWVCMGVPDAGKA
jgi:hypothetical protein